MLGQQLRGNLQSSWPFWTHLSQTSGCSPKNTEVKKEEALWVRLGFFSSWLWIFVPQVQMYSDWTLFRTDPSHFLKSPSCQLRPEILTEAAAKSEMLQKESHHQCVAAEDSSGPKRDNSPQPHAANYRCLLLDLVITQPHHATASFVNLR